MKAFPYAIIQAGKSILSIEEIIMTEKERQKKIKEVRQEFKELEHVPKSDWHAGFEALLRIEIHGFGNKVRMMTEMTLGTEPPRADYVILMRTRRQILARTSSRFSVSTTCLSTRIPGIP